MWPHLSGCKVPLHREPLLHGFAGMVGGGTQVGHLVWGGVGEREMKVRTGWGEGVKIGDSVPMQMQVFRMQ